MNKAVDLDFDQITLKSYQNNPFYLNKNIENISDGEFFKVLVDFIDELYESQLDTDYHIGNLTKREQIQKGEFTNYSHLYMLQPNSNKGYPYFKTEEGYFLIGHHKGDEKTSHSTYKRLFAEMAQLQVSLGDYILE